MTDLQQNTFEQIQSLCRDFRRQLKNAAPVCIEDYLNRVEEDSREMLFQNLLHIDIEFQRRQGQEPASEEYINRFPQHAKLIRQAFFESTRMSADPAAETPAEQRTQLEDVPAGRRLGDYELQRQIGRGAFGAVYKAKHLQRGDTVALKLLPLAIDGNADTSGDADRLHKFRREFRALCDVNHPNLVGMQSLEVDGRQWFFTMDLVEGTDFLDFVRPGGTIDIGHLKNAARQLAEGLAELHRRQIVHRDLKPANVMVDGDGHVSILDFGLVIEGQPRADFTVLMSTHGFAGTPLYAAPEQMFGDCDAASDWYAVGVMLYEALTGTPPFRGSGADLMRTKSATAAPPLRDHPGIPDDLGQLVDDLLQRDPELRPTGDQVLDRLGVATEVSSHDSTEILADSVGSGSQLSLIGRDSELKTLRSLHQRLMEHREPLAVFVKGRSGEGKTSLAEAFLRSVRTDGGTLVLAGRCYDRESVPFKAIDAVIDSLVLFLRSRPEQEVRGWLPDDIGLLAQLFPMLRRVTSIGERIVGRSDAQDARQLRHRAFAALRDLLRAISAATPVILFVDDLQWGDGDSATALRDVLQPPQAPAVLLLGTYRSDEANDSAYLKEWATYTSLSDEQLSQHELEVGPLSEDQCLSLLAIRLGIQPDALKQQAQQLFEGTHGNPYFLEQLLEGFDPQTGNVEAVPLADVIERRLQRLPPAARSVLKAVAVAGQAVALSEAAAVAEQAAAAMSTVTHMRNERLVRLIGVSDESTVDTYHDKIRETVLAGLPAEERGQLHLQFAELFLQQTPQTAVPEPHDAAAHPRIYDVAFHLLEAGDARAFEFQLAAGEKALQECALETAQGYLTTADQLLPHDADDTTRFRLWFSAAETHRGVDQLDEAIAGYEQALPLAANTVALARCESGLGQAKLRLGRTHVAREHLSRALSHLDERLPTTWLGRSLAIPKVFAEFVFVPKFLLKLYRRRHTTAEENGLATQILGTAHYCFMTTYAEMAMIMAHAGALGRISSDPADRLLSLTNFANNLSGTGFHRAALWFLRNPEQQLQAIRSPLQRAIVEHNLGIVAFFLGNLGVSETRFRTCLPALQRVRHHYVGMTLHWLRHIESVRGDAREIENWARQELRFGEATGEVVTIAYGRYGMADAFGRRGDYQLAVETARQAVNALEETEFITVNIARQELGRALLQASEYDAASEILKSTARNVFLGGQMFEIFLDTFSLYVEALAGPRFAEGRTIFPSTHVRQVSRAARWARWMCGRFPTLRPHACRVSGRAACAAGHTRRARKYFDEAIRAAERVGARYELARTWIDRSWLPYTEAAADRARGLALLTELNCVLPEAEAEQLKQD
ncbi:MAG: protein kinase [Fuerstiella sp.]